MRSRQLRSLCPQSRPIHADLSERGVLLRFRRFSRGLFSFAEEGSIYSRLGTPTTDEAENRIALLEGGIGAVSFASGMAALSGFILNFLQSGDAMAASGSLYGGSVGLLTDTLPRLWITAHFFDTLNPDSLESVMDGRMRLVSHTTNIGDDFLRVSVGIEHKEDIYRAICEAL